MFLVGNDQRAERFTNARQKENFFKFSNTKLVNVCVNSRPESSINITPKIIGNQLLRSYVGYGRSGSSLVIEKK